MNPIVKYQKLAGLLMVIPGFILMLIHALRYIFDLQITTSSFPFALMLVSFGALLIQLSRSVSQKM